jgi:hypothetical protein
MKNEALKKLIKEEIKNILELETAPTTAPEIKKLTDYRDTKADFIQGINRVTREQLEVLTKYVNDLGSGGA